MSSGERGSKQKGPRKGKFSRPREVGFRRTRQLEKSLSRPAGCPTLIGSLMSLPPLIRVAGGKWGNWFPTQCSNVC